MVSVMSSAARFGSSSAFRASFVNHELVVYCITIVEIVSYVCQIYLKKNCWWQMIRNGVNGTHGFVHPVNNLRHQYGF